MSHNKSRGSESGQQEYFLSRRVIQSELLWPGKEFSPGVTFAKPCEPSGWSPTPAQKARAEWMKQSRDCKSGEGITFLH